MAKLFRSFPLTLRTAVPAILRSSEAEKSFAFPPPMSSRRLALSPAGLWRSVVSRALPVTSPEAIRSAAAERTTESSVRSCGCGLSLAPFADFPEESTTATTRHSVSSCEGGAVASLMFMMFSSIPFRVFCCARSLPLLPYQPFCDARFHACPRFVFLLPSHFHFSFSVAEVHACGNEGEALLLGLANQLVQLATVNQQLARAQRLMIEDVAMLIDTNVRVDEPEFAILHQSISVFQVGAPAANGLHLRATQSNSGLELVQKEIIVRGSPIDRRVAQSAGRRIAPTLLLLLGTNCGLGRAGHGDKLTR